MSGRGILFSPMDFTILTDLPRASHDNVPTKPLSNVTKFMTRSFLSRDRNTNYSEPLLVHTP